VGFGELLEIFLVKGGVGEAAQDLLVEEVDVGGGLFD